MQRKGQTDALASKCTHADIRLLLSRQKYFYARQLVFAHVLKALEHLELATAAALLPVLGDCAEARWAEDDAQVTIFSHSLVQTAQFVLVER